jgi:hypothetical protein
VALLAALAFVAGDNFARLRHLVTLEKLPGVRVAPPVPDAAAATGYVLGRRQLILPRVDYDTYHWIMQVQTTLAHGPERLRRVEYDNAPFGREVHWALPQHAWLAFLARADHAVSGRALGRAVEDAALVSNPLLLGLLLLALIPLAARRFGSAAAALLALGLVSSYPFYLNFTAGNAEHHGAAQACALVMVVCLLGGGAGWVRDRGKPEERQARIWFLASAAAGGLGIWISAASLAPILVGTGLGALASFGVRAGPAGGEAGSIRPELWRWWGLAGGAFSLLAYGIEYFPGHLGWRLEVNHPLYGLAWMGGGELLCRTGRWAAGPTAERGSGGAAIVAALVLLGALPTAILLGGGRAFLLADPFLWRLHTQYILEFQSLSSYLSRRGFDFTAIARVLPLALLVPSLVFLGRRDTARFRKVQLALALGPAALESILATQQIRWWGFAAGLALVGTLPLLSDEEPSAPGPRRRGWWLACALLLAPGAASALLLARADSAYGQDEVFGLAERDLASQLRLWAGPAPLVVLSTPDTTTSLIYHGSVEGLGTLYWENRDGLAAAAEIFAAPTAARAGELLRARRVGAIVLVSWDPFLAPYVRLARGLPPRGSLPAGSFAATLLGAGPLPPWLRAIPYPLPPHPALRGQRVWIYAVALPPPGR